MVIHKEKLNYLTSELCYWLGYIAADGSISKDGYKLTFCIKTDDIILLEKLKDYFGVTNKITSRKVYDARTKKHYNSTSLQICDAEFVKMLSKFNLTNTKSKDFSIPESILNSDYLFDFLRGLLDGDGCIIPKTRVSFIGTQKTIVQIKNILEKNFNIVSNTITNKSNDKRYEAYQITYYRDALELLNKVYENGYILKRKYDLFLHLKKLDEEKLQKNSGVITKRIVKLYDKKGNLIKTFDSIKECAKFLKLSDSYLCNIIAKRFPQLKDYTVIGGDYIKIKKFRNGTTKSTKFSKKDVAV